VNDGSRRPLGLHLRQRGARFPPVALERDRKVAVRDPAIGCQRERLQVLGNRLLETALGGERGAQVVVRLRALRIETGARGCSVR